MDISGGAPPGIPRIPGVKPPEEDTMLRSNFVFCIFFKLLFSKKYFGNIFPNKSEISEKNI